MEQYGDWVYQNETKWDTASVTASIPSTTSSVKVYIHGTSDGNPDFKAWIDLISLSITEIRLTIHEISDMIMRMTFAVDLFEFKD